MATYRVKMQHSEETFVRLSHKQYDLFCQSNRLFRTIISVAAIFAGVLNFEQWWGIALTAYGCYMSTSTYAQANHTAHKLADQIRERGMSFPASEYIFRKNYMEIIALPERDDEEPTHMKYKDFLKFAEDRDYFYLFRDQYGGYMVPKEQLNGQVDQFRGFMEKATGLYCEARTAPWVKLIRRMSSPIRKGR